MFDRLIRCGAPDSVAIVAADAPSPTGLPTTFSYAMLVEAVTQRRRALDLAERSVVVLTGTNSAEWVVSYLALLAERHVPILAGGHVDRLVDRWAPDAVVTADASGWSIDRFATDAHDLHPDLALLMSTSGSTGSPKLVRLSAGNLIANASSIVEFQGLTAVDRGITNLPLHYSFGLSVLNSHLAAGAGIVVTARSVVEPEFAAAIREHRITNIAGVPHTYDLLDQIGPGALGVDSLRFFAQAGGRMDPDRVRTWVERAHEWGVDWFAMYGQTEATARMSYVPPTVVRDHPEAIGVAIPGGHLSIEPIDPDESDDPSLPAAGVGEIVYRGPNVMLGYAEQAPDLARGADLDALHTGDLGRLDPETGMLAVVGRRSRRVKPFGFRVDLDDLERRLAEAGVAARVAGDDDLVVAACTDADPRTVRHLLAVSTALPGRCLCVVDGPPPINANGKVDYARLLADGRAAREVDGDIASVVADDPRATLVAVAAEVLGRPDVDLGASFVSLGGDSLSYIECSVRFEGIVGALPPDWHLRPLGELVGNGRPPRRTARLDTTVLLRSIGILAVVSTHMRLWHVPGGAHLMLGVVGYNIARFLLPVDDTRERMRAGLRTAARVAVPTMLWTLVFMVFAQYTWTTLTLANNYIGPRSHAGNHWHFWFIEVFVHLVLLTTLVTAVPVVRRADLRWPYAFPLALLGLVLTLRMEWADMGDWYNLRFRTHAVAWFFVLGWLVYRSSTWQQRLLTTVLCLATAPGVFQNPRREYFIALGLVLLVWARDLPFPRVAVRPVATLAAASMWIFISHFMIWPPMKELFIVDVAYPLTILASLGVWWTMTQAPRHLATRFALDRWFRRVARPYIAQKSNHAPTRAAPTPV